MTSLEVKHQLRNVAVKQICLEIYEVIEHITLPSREKCLANRGIMLGNIDDFLVASMFFYNFCSVTSVIRRLVYTPDSLCVASRALL